MVGDLPNPNQGDLFSLKLENMLNPKEPLYKLANCFPWDEIEEDFRKYYIDFGRPAKAIRLMVSLLILKQLFNLSDDNVVEQWIQNPYFQYFSGEAVFQWRQPCAPSDISHFRKRIGKNGVEKIFQLSIKLHGKDVMERELVVDTTVQEKNITFPTDTKLQVKIINQCRKIAKDETIKLRQSYTRTLPGLIRDQRFKRNSKTKKKAIKSARKIKVIAGRLVRELHRKLSDKDKLQYLDKLSIFEKILSQKRGDKNKIYSIHEPGVYCMAKGKEHKKYEFGCKASISLTKTTGIIVGAMSFEKNVYDGHTLPEVLEQIKKLTGRSPNVVIADRGYRGKQKIDQTKIIIPKPLPKSATNYQKQKTRKRFRRRAGIEPIIGHLKSDFRLARNFLKGNLGDNINLMMAATAFNIKKWMRKVKTLPLFIFQLLQNNLNFQTAA